MTEKRELRDMQGRRLLVLGITGNWAFAAGTLLLSLNRHHPGRDFDILLFHDNTLSEKDASLFRDLGACCQKFDDAGDCLSDEMRAQYSPLCLAKFICFELLDQYETIVWLDADVVIQDSIDEIWNFGPLSLANEDICFYEDQRPRGMKINGTQSLPDIDPERPNINSGVFVLNRTLPSPRKLAALSLDYLMQHKDVIRFADQAAFNMLACILSQNDPPLFTELPVRFNCHPRNRNSLHAPIVHAFGAYKLWNDGLTQACFPEWQRDYLRWQRLGGSCWQGKVDNANYKDVGPFALLTSFFSTMEKSEQALKETTSALKKERSARMHLEKTMKSLAARLVNS